MINKQNIWFTFLFSIILVLSIFYVTMNDADLSEYIDIKENDETSLVVSESSELVNLRVQNEEEVLASINELQDILLDAGTDIMKKNDAYDSLLTIKNNINDEEKIVGILKKEFNFDSFVKINGENVTIVVEADKYDEALANKIITRVNKEFSSNKYITVKFN